MPVSSRHRRATSVWMAAPPPIATRSVLKSNGMLTRDARAKERKHYGLKRARKAPTYTKR